MTVVDDFLATATGAAAAGVIGLATLLIQQSLDRRRKQDEEILGPAFSFVMGIPEHPTWTGIGEPPWAGLDSYHWLRVPKRYRRPLSEMSKRLQEYGGVWGRYFQFSGGTANKRIVASTREGLAGYATDDGSTVLAERLGIEGGAVIVVAWIATGILPYVVMNPGAADRAWDQLLKEGPDSLYWSKQIVEALRTRDPATLQRVFDGISQIPEISTAREIVNAFRESHRKLLEQAKIVRTVLATRLGVRPLD